MTANPIPIHTKMKTLEVASSAFGHEGFIPSRYTCDGRNINPSILVKNIPPETKSLALILDDPDAPLRTWVHWLVWNIQPSRQIKENSAPGVEGNNDFGMNHYGGPCPPSGTHRYFFKVYALDDVLELTGTVTKDKLEKAMSSHIIGFGELVGLYKREQ